MGLFVQAGQVLSGAAAGLAGPFFGAISLEIAGNCLYPTNGDQRLALAGATATGTFLVTKSIGPQAFNLALQSTATAACVIIAVDATLAERASWTKSHWNRTTVIIATAEALGFLVHPAVGVVSGVILGYFLAPKQKID